MNRFACTIVSALAVAAALTGGCDGSTPRPPNGGNYAFVVTQPPESAIVGTYVLIDQTVVRGGLSAMQGRQGRLDLRTDGTFTVTDYPNWSEVSSGDADKFTSFISTSGRWTIDRVGTTYDYGPNPKASWGITFSDAESQIDPTAFTGQTVPYGLVSILGDPDSDMVLRFEKRQVSPVPP